MKYGLFELVVAIIIWLLLGHASSVNARQVPPLPSPVAWTATPRSTVQAPTPEPRYFVWLPIAKGGE